MADARVARISGFNEAIAKALVELCENGREASVEQLQTYESTVLLVTTRRPLTGTEWSADKESKRQFVVDKDGSFHRLADRDRR